ncbi:MAG: MBL fold metallo-hydrolase [Candidatus Aminicenantes bacterium]|nr:MAG: MBL fold metallo-hydrolase [Candidatus Aminicenantes bacterium]
MGLKIKVLQVLHGDAIIINFQGDDGNSHNIFIDGGFSSTYARTIRRETEKIIERNEKIDLFVITHIDQDHIGGVLRFLKEYGKRDIVDRYWFNWCDNLDVSIPDNNWKISYSQGINLRDYLSNIGKLNLEGLHENLEPTDLYGAKITILSPRFNDLEHFRRKWIVKEENILKREPISANQSDYCFKIEELSKRAFIEDTRIENKVSISFLFEYNNKTVLFLADSHPSTIENELKERGFSRDKRLKVELIKLSHHASKFNTNPGLLELVECNSFIISANGRNRHYFPHKETLSRVLTNPGRKRDQKVSFIFNYDNAEIRSIFKESDLSLYNFKCVYPAGEENGYVIEL